MPTFLAASNTATDIVGFVNDDPMQMYEVMSADTAFNANEVGHCADQVFANGTSPLYISRSKIATTANTQAQLFIMGVSRDQITLTQLLRALLLEFRSENTSWSETTLREQGYKEE